MYCPDLLPPPVGLGISVRVWHFIKGIEIDQVGSFKWNFYIIRLYSFISDYKAETSFLLMVNV